MHRFAILFAFITLCVAAESTDGGDAKVPETPAQISAAKAKAKDQMADAAEVARLLDEGEQRMNEAFAQLKETQVDKATQPFLEASARFGQLQVLGVTRKNTPRYKTSYDRFIRLTQRMLAATNPFKDAVRVQ